MAEEEGVGAQGEAVIFPLINRVEAHIWGFAPHSHFLPLQPPWGPLWVSTQVLRWTGWLSRTAVEVPRTLKLQH